MKQELAEKFFPRLTRQHGEQTAAQRSAELKRHTEAFLKNGGTIKKIPSGLARLDEYGRTPEQKQQHLESARGAALIGGRAKAELIRQQKLGANQ